MALAATATVAGQRVSTRVTKMLLCSSRPRRACSAKRTPTAKAVADQRRRARRAQKEALHKFPTDSLPSVRFQSLDTHQQERRAWEAHTTTSNFPWGAALAEALLEPRLLKHKTVTHSSQKPNVTQDWG